MLLKTFQCNLTLSIHNRDRDFANRDFEKDVFKMKTVILDSYINEDLVQVNFYCRTRLIASSTCKIRLVTRNTRLATRSTCLPIRSTGFSTRSTCLSTHSTHLSTRSTCPSTRSTRLFTRSTNLSTRSICLSTCRTRSALSVF